MANKKSIKSLIKYYELDEDDDMSYFSYILDSEINGQQQQVRDLYNQMKPQDQCEFKSYLRTSEYPIREQYNVLKTLGLVC